MKKSLKLSALVLALVMSVALCSCNISLGNEVGNQEEMSLVEEIVAEIQKECELPEMTAISEDQLFQYYDIDKNDVANFSAYVSTDSMTKDEIVLIEALTESEACTIRDSLTAHHENLLEESKEYLPDEYEMIKNCEVVKDGIYIRLFISNDADKMEDIYNSYMQ